ncbi:MAG TPA: hypothetical protein VKO63_09780 [Chitinispirillaceae bacterium]|nr:hypothetical protein [Chitinispirillaceae bacterium]
MAVGMRSASSIIGIISAGLLINSMAKSSFQYDGATGYTIVKPHQYADTNGAEGFDVNSYLYATRSFNKSIELTFQHMFTGSNNTGLYPERSLPFTHSAGSTLQLNGFGTLVLGASNDFYYQAKPLAVPYYQAGTEIIPQMLTTGEGQWGGAFEWFHCQANTYASLYNFELRLQDRYATRETLEASPYGNQRDVDLWADISAGADIPLDIAVDAGMIAKDNLTEDNNYDIYKYRVGLSGEHQLNRNKFLLSWDASEYYVTSQMMKENGYADGLMTDVMARFVWRLKSDLFVKGEVDVDLADKMFKQYYELQMRKTWKQGSSLDLLYFATNGVLFPRQSLAINSVLRLHEHFGISPSAALYMSQMPSETAFRYYRSDIKIELLFPVNPRLDFYTGYNLTHYDRHPLFATRNSVCAGIRTW